MAFGVPVIQLYTSDPSIIGSSPIGYTLTDHNRQPLQISYDTIENSARMANGTLRRYITANKKKIGISWDMVPAAGGYNFTADSNLGAAWLKSFYEENIYNPVWIKMNYSEEGWRFANNQTATTKFMSTNSTFNNSTVNSSSISNIFNISAFSFSAISGGSGTASITTTINHNIPASSEIYIKGVNQIFNGTWVVSSVSSNVFAFNFKNNSNASATFKINSYNQSGNTASFNVDNNAFINNGAVLSISNSQPLLGSSINGTWTVIGNKTGQTYFTASSTTSQTARGQYGDATIVSSTSYSGTPSVLSQAQAGVAITSDILKVFITSFSYEIIHRSTSTDMVNMNIEFTEI